MDKREREKDSLTALEWSNGSVFEALGYENADEMEMKSCLVSEISETIRRRGLTQIRAAEIANIDQPTLSKLLRGRTRSISTDRLTEILNALGRNVTIVISEFNSEIDPPRGHTRVVVADSHRIAS